MDPNWIGAIAGVVSVILAVPGAYVLVRRNRARRLPALPQSGPQTRSDGSYDVFISYAEEDAERVHRLAESLDRRGIKVFLDTWCLLPGDVIIVRLEEGISASANGVLVFSRAAVAQQKIMDEYAALLQRARAESGRRFIPVLIEDVNLPPFAEIRQPTDLRDERAPDYEAKISTLAKAVRPKPVAPDAAS